jgi:hypothetical protein
LTCKYIALWGLSGLLLGLLPISDRSKWQTLVFLIVFIVAHTLVAFPRASEGITVVRSTR